MSGLKQRNTLWIGLIGGLVGLLVWLAFFWEPFPQAVPGQPPAHAQPAVPPVAPGGDFTLRSASGPVALADFRGEVVLVYFGYTSCPDVCPTSLAALAQAMSMLRPDELAHVHGLFVTLDPERDTADILAVYAPYFHPRIVGLTGSAAEIAEIAGRYGVRYMKQRPNADGYYSVDHSSEISVVGPDGALATRLPHGTPAEHIVERIRALLGPTPVRSGQSRRRTPFQKGRP